MLSIINKAKLSKKLLIILLLSSLLLVMGCVTAPTRGWSGPTVNDGVLYVGTIESKVIAIDASNGQTVYWEKELEDTSSGGFACSSGISKPMSTYGTPVVNEERVYIGGYDGKVYSFTVDGSMGSDFDTGSAIVGSLVIDGDTIYVGNSDGEVYALSTDNVKNQVWSTPFKTGGKIWATPAVADGVVYIGSSDHNFYAIDADSGQEKWHFETGSGVFSTPVIDNGVVYFGSCDNKFYAINADTGAEIWHFEAENWFWTEALIYGGEIWVGNFDGNVYVLNAESGTKISEFETEGRVSTPPVVVTVSEEDRIIIGSEDGYLYIINPANKSYNKLGSNLEAPIFAPIGVDRDNGIIYVHAQNGDHMLYAIDVEDGSQIWTRKTSG